MIKEVKILDCSNLRKVCIENDFYTCGSIEEYNNLFKKLYNLTELGKKSLTIEGLKVLAEDIKEHSNTDKGILDIMYDINRACLVYFEEE